MGGAAVCWRRRVADQLSRVIKFSDETGRARTGLGGRRRDTRPAGEGLEARALLTRLDPDEVPIAIRFLTGWPPQGRVGVGWATVASARDHAPAAEPTLELRDVDHAIGQLISVRGKNSTSERARLIGDLFARATANEQEFLSGLMIGEVRQGALEGVLLEAVTKASGLPADELRRAVMMAGDLGAVARAALGDDRDKALSQYQLELFRPVQPMLADSASTVGDALSAGVPVAVEWKLDGARIQVHRREDRVAVYTRSLNDVTAAVPEVVEAVMTLPARQLILDGEVIALMPDGRPHSFQTTTTNRRNRPGHAHGTFRGLDG